MEIEVRGHSGCNIDIVRKGKRLLIEKSTCDPKYIERLYNQALKQKKACETQLQFIRIPEIIDITKSDTEMVILMDYVYSKNFIDYFENAGFEQIDFFVKAIGIFIDSEVERSSMIEVPVSVVLDKWEDVKQKILSNPFTSTREDVQELLIKSDNTFQNHLKSSIQSINIPLGVCHGDLTLSNILFNGNNYFLIDFLDSFIESPLLDMVKMRQDTAHHWSTLMYEGNYDKTRFYIITKKIDDELNNLFSKYDWYNKYYNIFQVLNLLRVLQYAHEDKVVNYLVKELGIILNNMNV